LHISFHGNGKDMLSHASLTRFSNPKINPNTIAIFPNGLFGSTPKTRDERCWEGAPYCKSHNDTLFVSEMLAHVRDSYCVDVERVYASGKSIGAGFVDLLACTADVGREFAAFGVSFPPFLFLNISS
jgi:poly(3-hydroxybutyrate) depolymerase